MQKKRACPEDENLAKLQKRNDRLEFDFIKNTDFFPQKKGTGRWLKTSQYAYFLFYSVRAIPFDTILNDWWSVDWSGAFRKMVDNELSQDH